MDDTTTDDVAGLDGASGSERSLTRRQAVGAGAAGLTVLALGADSAGATTNATVSGFNRTVVVHAPKKVVFDLKQVEKLQRDILGQLGCRACCSGWTIQFPDEVEFVLGRGNTLKALSPDQINKRLGVSG